MSATDAGEQTASDNTPVRPFQVDFPESELAELRRRINATRWPERETVTDTLSRDRLGGFSRDAVARLKTLDRRDAEIARRRR